MKEKTNNNVYVFIGTHRDYINFGKGGKGKWLLVNYREKLRGLRVEAYIISFNAHELKEFHGIMQELELAMVR